jgi:hypothetical protein
MGILEVRWIMKLRFVFVLSLSFLLLVGLTDAKVKGSSAKRPVKKEQAAEPAPPPPPQTLAEMAPSAPEVSFQGGQLTISAKNSTLGDILDAVKAQTRATVDLPGNASERVIGHFGPGPARDVLTSLLNGSHFNYLLLGSPSDPNALDRVILMAKSAGGAQNAAPPNEQATAYNPAPYNRPIASMAAPGGNTTVVEGQNENADDSTDDSADDSADNTDDATADDQADQTDDQTTGEEEQQAAPEGQANVKSPEQLLQEMQQRQQQLLQQQQQGIQPGGAGFPTPGAPGLPPGAPHN